MITLIALMSAHAGDKLSITTDGTFPADCALHLAFEDGTDWDSRERCTVYGDGGSGEYACWVNDGVVGHINDSESYMEVQVAPAYEVDCAIAGGVKIKKVHGNGDSKNFTWRNFRKGTNFFYDDNSENACIENFFSDKVSGVSQEKFAKFHIAGNNHFKDGKMLTSVRFSGKHTQDTTKVSDCVKASAGFCRLFDDEQVRIKSPAQDYLGLIARSPVHGLDVTLGWNGHDNARWDVECHPNGTVTLFSDQDRFLRSTPQGAVIQAENDDGYWQRWRPERNDNGSFSFKGHHGTWMRATNWDEVDMVSNKNNWERWKVDIVE